MKNVWTWSGKYFGYIDGDNLWTQSGKHIGKFYGEEIYDCHGKYIGEVRNNNRLIRSKSKSHRQTSSFSPYCSRCGVVGCVSYVGNVMIAGYEDFYAED